MFENGSLYFPKVRNSDEGGYRCEGLSDQRDIAAQIFTSELVISCKYHAISLPLGRTYISLKLETVMKVVIGVRVFQIKET